MSNSTKPETPSQAIDTASDMVETDISQREKEILDDALARMHGDFILDQSLSRSDYYGSGRLGAFHYTGWYKNQPAVIKIQGAKPLISEQIMIESFVKNNKSKIIRPPYLYTVLPWEDERGYEALIMELVEGKKVLQTERLATKDEIVEFFTIYQEYKQNIPREPWLPKPRVDLTAEFTKLKAVAAQRKPDSPFRKADDTVLIETAQELLKNVWADSELEFQHGHFSAEDLIRKGDEVVLFSQLFWRWKHPFYDAVFAYHWAMYTLASIPGITPEKIEEQRSLWLTEIEALPQIDSERKSRELTAALLERAVAGLAVDSMAYIDEQNPVAEYMVVSTRNEVTRLINRLQ